MIQTGGINIKIKFLTIEVIKRMGIERAIIMKIMILIKKTKETMDQIYRLMKMIIIKVLIQVIKSTPRDTIYLLTLGSSLQLELFS
jgi:hypothetical protein